MIAPGKARAHCDIMMHATVPYTANIDVSSCCLVRSSSNLSLLRMCLRETCASG